MNFDIFDIPNNLQIDKQIRQYKFDRYKKCVYFLLENGIYRKCYSDSDSINKNILQQILFSRNIKGFQLESAHDFMYIFNKHQIIVIKLSMGVRKTIYKTNRIIYSINIFPQFG